MSELITIGELARRTGVSTYALRYYDELGLVRPSRRVSGHRRYAVDAVAPQEHLLECPNFCATVGGVLSGAELADAHSRAHDSPEAPSPAEQRLPQAATPNES